MANPEHPLSKKPLECEICGSVFKYHSKLSRHLLVHSKTKLFKCKYCDSAFALSHNLKVHLRIHLGVKPYKCSFAGCDKSFTQSNNMRVHMRIHKVSSSLMKKEQGCVSFKSEREEDFQDGKSVAMGNGEDEMEFEIETEISENSFYF